MRCSPPRLGAGVTLTITVKHHAILVDDAAVVTVVALGLALSFSPSSHSSRCDVSRCVAPVSISGARTHSHTRQRDAPSHRIAHWGGRDEGGTGGAATDGQGATNDPFISAP